jgi:lipopolysaccharide transport protein LptA
MSKLDFSAWVLQADSSAGSSSGSSTRHTRWVHRHWQHLMLSLIVSSITVLGAFAQTPSVQTDTAITLDAASSEVDYRTNTVVFRDLSISQGNTRVTADRARSTGLDFNDSTWVLSGRVRITVQGGDLRADAANVTFKENRITQAMIEGKPAQFSQELARGGTARGEAAQIIYQIDQQSVTLREKAWLTDGRNEIRGEQLVYGLREQRVQAGSQTGSKERVQIIIRPTPAEAPP